MSGADRRRWLILSAIGAAALAVVVAVVLMVRPAGDDAASPPPSVAPPTTGPASATTSPSTPQQVVTLPASRPETLEVPAIGVRSGPIIDLGLDAAGALEVPGDAVTLGWYDGSPTPGELGPSVLAGHVNFDHVQGIFGRLNELSAGDQAIVHRADGSTAVFTVYRVEAYPKSAFPTDDVYGNTEAPELRLITCGGAFDAASRNYEDNIVAYARLSGTQP
jgi:sortase (surface protein transpeptidase)